MLTLGIRRICIILRHIQSWFEAVLALAILQSCAQRGPKWPFWGQKWPNMASLPMSQTGLRGPKMIPDDQYNMFLTIWGHFGPNLAYKKILGKFTKVLGFGKTPPHVGKNSQIISFFFFESVPKAKNKTRFSMPPPPSLFQELFQKYVF